MLVSESLSKSNTEEKSVPVTSKFKPDGQESDVQLIKLQDSQAQNTHNSTESLETDSEIRQQDQEAIHKLKDDEREDTNSLKTEI